MRAALYARVSIDKQAEKYGIPSQIEASRKRSLERSWAPVLDGDKDAFVDDGYLPRGQDVLQYEGAGGWH